MLSRQRLPITIAIAVGLFLASCARPAMIVTPEGKVAWAADQVVVRINRLQDTVIQAEATGGLPTDTTRTIVEFAVAANKVLKETPAGWQGTVLAAWSETKAKLPAITNLGVLAAIDAVDVVLTTLATQ